MARTPSEPPGASTSQQNLPTVSSHSAKSGGTFSQRMETTLTTDFPFIDLSQSVGQGSSEAFKAIKSAGVEQHLQKLVLRVSMGRVELRLKKRHLCVILWFWERPCLFIIPEPHTWCPRRPSKGDGSKTLFQPDYLLTLGSLEGRSWRFDCLEFPWQSCCEGLMAMPHNPLKVD